MIEGTLASCRGSNNAAAEPGTLHACVVLCKNGMALRRDGNAAIESPAQIHGDGRAGANRNGKVYKQEEYGGHHHRERNASSIFLYRFFFIYLFLNFGKESDD